MTPVSYTHLDVYKRQVGNMAYSVYGQTLNNGRFLGVVGREEQPFYTAFLGFYRHADNSARENTRAAERNLSDKGTVLSLIHILTQFSCFVMLIPN